MAKLLEKAVEAVRHLPDLEQDDIAHAMLALAEKDGDPEPVESADLPAVLEGLSQARRREFASEEQIEAVFRRFAP